MNLKPINQQVVVVMGASSGIGRETAYQFARRGAKVVISARSESGLATLSGTDVGVEPATATPPYRPGEDSLLTLIADAFDTTDVPEEVAERLLRSGFVRIEGGGLFSSDYYVMPDQLASVSNDGARLRVPREELIEDEW